MNQDELKEITNICVNKIIAGKFCKTPYEHLIVDKFLPKNLIQNCLKSFPDLEDDIWEHEKKDTDIEVKSRTTWKSEFDIPEDIKIVVEKQTIVKVSGSDKQAVGMVCSKIKSFRPPEPYKGKGIKEQGQYILRKEGKKK